MSGSLGLTGILLLRQEHWGPRLLLLLRMTRSHQPLRWLAHTSQRRMAPQVSEPAPAQLARALQILHLVHQPKRQRQRQAQRASDCTKRRHHSETRRCCLGMVKMDHKLCTTTKTQTQNNNLTAGGIHHDGCRSSSCWVCAVLRMQRLSPSPPSACAATETTQCAY